MDLQPLTLQERFEFYLNEVNILRSKLTIDQYRELKRAFASGLSQAVVLLFTIDDVKNLDKEIFRLAKELKYFWEGENIASQLKF